MASSLRPADALGALPASLRSELLAEFNKIVRDFREERWEPAELNGGKLCEIVYTILRGHVDGQFPSRSKKPKNFKQACEDLGQLQKSSFPQSVRITVPRVLVSVYEIRNNRGVGHVGGDVDPNHMDAVFVLGGAKWVLAELVRIFHDVDVATAAQVVDALTERTLPIVYPVEGRKRVLDPSLSMANKTLLLLYSETGPVAERDLVDWAEYSNPSEYRKRVLKRLHNKKYIEYDTQARKVHLLPPGAKYVEENLPLIVP